MVDGEDARVGSSPTSHNHYGELNLKKLPVLVRISVT